MSHLPIPLKNRLNQTESAVLKFLMLYFQRIPIFQIISFRCTVWRPYNVSPYISIVLLFHFLVLWDYGVQHWTGNRVSLNLWLGRIFQYLSWTDSVKPNLLFSNFGYMLYLQRISFSDHSEKQGLACSYLVWFTCLQMFPFLRTHLKVGDACFPRVCVGRRLLLSCLLSQGLRQLMYAWRGMYFACRDLPITCFSKPLGFSDNDELNTEMHIYRTKLGIVTLIIFTAAGGKCRLVTIKGFPVLNHGADYIFLSFNIMGSTSSFLASPDILHDFKICYGASTTAAYEQHQ